MTTALAEQTALEDYVRELVDRARDNGAESALVSAGLWRDLAFGAVAYLAATGRHFTADDLRDIAGEPPSDNAIGAVLLTAAKRREIASIGFERSTRPSRRAGVLRVWRGTEHAGVDERLGGTT